MTMAPLALALMLAAAAPVQDTSLEGRTIVAVRVEGLRHISEAIVLAQMESAPGRPYHRAAADRDVLRLDRLGVFGEIAISGVPVDDGIRVEVTLTETPRIVPALAIAVTDENGVSAGPALKVTSLAGRPFDLGLATRFGGEMVGQFSEASAPLSNRRLWHSAKLSLSDRFNKLDEFQERAIDLDARVGIRTSDQWKSGAIVQYYSVNSDLDGITLSPLNSDSFTSIGGVTEYDTRDSWRAPSRGWWNSVDAFWRTGSGRYETLDFDVRRYQPVASRQTVVATALLTLQTGVSGQDIPTYADYVIGGENTIRGHRFSTRRGKNQLITTVEYRYTAIPARSFRFAGLNLYGGVALAAFTDVGSAWSTPDGFSDGVIGGGGIGLRVYVPYINMIRLDLSFGSGLMGGVGINEKAVAQRNRVR